MEAVRRSFHKVAMLNSQAGLQFCDRLRALDPGLGALIGDDPGPPAAALMAALASVVRHLANPAALETTLREVGERHRRRGIGDAHYATAGEALMSTLAVNLGPEFTPAVRGAWQALYGIVVRMMRGGACAPRVLSAEAGG